MADISGQINATLSLTGTISADGTLVGTISAGQIPSTAVLQEKTLTTLPLGASSVVPDDGYDGLSQVNLPAAFKESHEAGTVTLTVPTTFSPASYDTVDMVSNGGTTLKSYTAGGGGGGAKVHYGSSYTQLPAHAFDGASGIEEVEFESYVQIGDSAFTICNSIKTIKFLNTLMGSNLGEDTFAFSTASVDIYVYSRTMLAASNYAFYDYDVTKLTLHVPSDKLAEYEASTLWGNKGITILGDLPPVNN